MGRRASQAGGDRGPGQPRRSRRRRAVRREALACAAPGQPGIAHVDEIVSTPDGRFLAMENIEERMLAGVLGSGRLPVEEVARFGEAIARALAAAHERGIANRDVRAESAMVTGGGHASVLDSRIVSAAAPAPSLPPALTPGRVVGGAAGLPSPEQAAGREVERRGDPLSLGSLPCRMAPGGPAPSGDTAAETMGAVDRAERVGRRRTGREPGPRGG